ncbi:hypothetical protein RHSIM_Rhsim01G0095800 [Rhododendron simsii]|uniref:Disease resistance R13L4/SHOC-2-like LRR domain-containing protein n=1 Tax=Rhododendron simsii TaxID=118357 RepID=A0A834HE66_RHOSS|nr:hypothetical protein RHSIM_Rhsim01G0095800 [Rhododendron simsii]
MRRLEVLIRSGTRTPRHPRSSPTDPSQSHTISHRLSEYYRFWQKFAYSGEGLQIPARVADYSEIQGTEAVKGLILNAMDVQVNANPFEKMDELWYRELVLEVRRDGMTTSCLTELNLEDCHLSYLPDEIGNLIALRTLNLAGNSLSTLPDTIVKLSCLKDLLVENNKLSHLPSKIGDLDSLETLRLWGNKGLHALPESICELVRLRELGLYGCNLSHLPSEIDGLISLNHLNLGNCHLSHLPSGIGGLTSLEYLYISGNNICTIPDSISSLHRLDDFFLDNCSNLRSLPKLPTCTSVHAEHCPSLERLPLELDQLGRRVYYSESNKLAENSYLTGLLKQLPRSKGLSELQHAVDILVPVAGDEEVRIWFPYHDGRGPNVSFVVPPSPSPSVNQKIVGWLLRLLVWRPGGLRIQDVIFNKIKKRGLFDFVVFYRTEVDLVWLLYIPQGYARLRLKGGDEVEIPIIAYDNALVKNWAIDVIYEADDELHKGNDNLYQVMGPI